MPASRCPNPECNAPVQTTDQQFCEECGCNFAEWEAKGKPRVSSGQTRAEQAEQQERAREKAERKKFQAERRKAQAEREKAQRERQVEEQKLADEIAADPDVQAMREQLDAAEAAAKRRAEDKRAEEERQRKEAEAAERARREREEARKRLEELKQKEDEERESAKRRVEELKKEQELAEQRLRLLEQDGGGSGEAQGESVESQGSGSRGRKKRLVGLLIVLLFGGAVAAIFLAGPDDDLTAPTTTASVANTVAPTTTAAPATTVAPTTTAVPATTAAPSGLGDGSLGTVEVGAGEAIQIRSLNAISGDVAFLGIPNENGIRMAVEDYGQIGGHDVEVGTGLDDLCSADGGQAAAQTIVADEDVIGVIGTSCSGAATAASPLISAAGMVMISGSNTSPSLTSDLAGTAGPNYHVGYYRTAHNDLYQGQAAANFALEVLGVSSAAAIHDGDPYTEGLARAFADAFEAGGGTLTGFTAVNKGDTDMVPVLTEIAAGSPDMLFFPIFQPEGDFIIQQSATVSGLGGTVMMAADGLLNSNYLAVSETEGMYFSGPDVRYGANFNQSTGETAADVLADYEAEFGEAPAAPFWAHSYDAAALLMDAILAASTDDGGTLVIDRADVREYLNGVSNYSGLIGSMSCDAYGDCSSAKITVIQNTDIADYAASTANVVYEYAPLGGQRVGDIAVAFHIFTRGETDALENFCPDRYSVGHNECQQLVDDASARGSGGVGREEVSCSYNQVRAWLIAEFYNQPEWPLTIEQTCYGRSVGGSSAPHTFTGAETDALENFCPDRYSVGHNECQQLVDDASARGSGGVGREEVSCSYNQVRAWLIAEFYNQPEWPLTIEQTCF